MSDRKYPIVDPYLLLGVGRTATSDDLLRAYRKLSNRLDPAKNPHPGATWQFEQVQRAYNLLIDPTSRQNHEQQTLATQHGQETTYFSMRVTPSKRSIRPLEEAQVLYLLAEIHAPPNAKQQLDERKQHLNLTMIIDQSKSMDDNSRMTRVKAAAQAIISELDPNDILSIISFNDRASVIIPATQAIDKAALRGRIGMMKPQGGTEIFQGLNEGVKQNYLNHNRKYINHIILLTDGRTYGDEEACIELAKRCAQDRVTISALGIGSDWNDEFLDELVVQTGGMASYVRSVNMISDFLNEHIRSASDSFAERMTLSVVPDPDIEIEMAFQLTPHPHALKIDGEVLQLSNLPARRGLSALLQFQLPPDMAEGYRTVARLVASGEITTNEQKYFQAISDLSVEINANPAKDDEPPAAIVDALSKLTLFRLQQRAQEALDAGDVEEATQRLQFLATRLFDMGQDSLGTQAILEAETVSQTRSFSSEAARKTIKYQTRSLVGTAALGDAISGMLGSSTFGQSSDREK